ncbi:carbohydrate kinase family protein [Aestuariivirga sp.]|uniref:carbohydrate kinase family protein n=1 Tax=Aestuariivirga sp. TaxID=2650926 RepID=UPI0039E5761A
MADIAVFGGANIDIKAKVNAPNRLGTSNPGIVTTTAGGVGRNIAHNLARLGADVALISVVGHDVHGDAVLFETKRAGVDVSRVVRSDISTGSYVALLDHDGEMISALSDMRCADLLTPDVIVAQEKTIELARLVVADCNLPQESLNLLAAMAGGKLVIEPVSVPKSRKLIEVLKTGQVYLASPNFDQIEQMAGTRDIESAFRFLHGKGLTNVVIHAGPEGAFVSDGVEIEHVEAQPPQRIVDVTGAGDAAVAGLVYGLLHDEPLAVAAARGQSLAGRVIAGAFSTLE